MGRHAVLTDTRLTQLDFIFSSFILWKGINLQQLLKIVANLLKALGFYITDNVYHDCNFSFEICTISHIPFVLSLICQNILRHKEYSIANNAPDKLKILETLVLARLLGHQNDEPANDFEPSALSSLNRTLAWLGTFAWRLYAEYSSNVQHLLHFARIEVQINQYSIFADAKLLNADTKFNCPTENLQ